MKSPTLQQLTSYKLGKDGLKVKLNQEGLEKISRLEKKTGHFNNELKVSAIDFDNEIIQLFSKDSFILLNDVPLNWIELQLKPLSLLQYEIEFKGEFFTPIEWLEDKYYTLDLHKQCKRLLDEDGINWINQSDFMLVEHLIEWEFDVYGLNEQ